MKRAGWFVGWWAAIAILGPVAVLAEQAPTADETSVLPLVNNAGFSVSSCAELLDAIELPAPIAPVFEAVTSTAYIVEMIGRATVPMYVSPDGRLLDTFTRLPLADFDERHDVRVET